MKKWVLLAMLVLAMAICVFAGDSYFETRTLTTTFTYLGGDSTVASYYDTTYMPLVFTAHPLSQYRFNKLQYQANVTWGGMSNCTTWVQIQQGPGSHVSDDGTYDTLQSFVITDDSLYTTSGYDLIYTWGADSIKPHVRLRFIVRTDADDSGASAGEKVDSSYTIAHTIHAWGRD